MKYNYYNNETETTVTENVRTITISEIRSYHGMPIAILVDESGEEVGYLSPFRKYSFQVSGTFEGQGDMGSTRVVGLMNILGSTSDVNQPANCGWDETRRELLKGMASMAIMQFCGNHGYVYRDQYWNKSKMTPMICGMVPSNKLTKMLDVYSMDVMLYLDPNSMGQETKDFYLKKVETAA